VQRHSAEKCFGGPQRLDLTSGKNFLVLEHPFCRKKKRKLLKKARSLVFHDKHEATRRNRKKEKDSAGGNRHLNQSCDRWRVSLRAEDAVDLDSSRHAVEVGGFFFPEQAREPRQRQGGDGPAGHPSDRFGPIQLELLGQKGLHLLAQNTPQTLNGQVN
jgi:hypothetical protein